MSAWERRWGNSPEARERRRALWEMIREGERRLATVALATALFGWLDEVGA